MDFQSGCGWSGPLTQRCVEKLAGVRIDFGVECGNYGNVAVEFDVFFSWMGWRDSESCGAGIALRVDF